MSPETPQEHFKNNRPADTKITDMISEEMHRHMASTLSRNIQSDQETNERIATEDVTVHAVPVTYKNMDCMRVTISYIDTPPRPDQKDPTENIVLLLPYNALVPEDPAQEVQLADLMEDIMPLSDEQKDTWLRVGHALGTYELNPRWEVTRNENGQVMLPGRLDTFLVNHYYGDMPAHPDLEPDFSEYE